jgi:lysophospholipase L1-like esterase
MLLRKLSYPLAVVLLACAVQTGAAQDFFLKKGDVVVVMGDSITEQRLYSNYLEIWSQTRYPKYNLVFRNVGIGGDTSGGGNGRFKRDVLSHKPTVLTVDFGMNDGRYTVFSDKTFDPYMKGLQGIADQAKAAKIRVAWITPQPVEHNPGNDKQEAYNQTLEKFGGGVKEIAMKNDGLFADQFHPYWAVIKKARDAGEKGRITAGDAVHPGPPGQALMAASILKALGFPKQVSSVNIALEKSGQLVTRWEKCKTSTPKIEAGHITFERTDAAIPYFPDQAKSILKWTPLVEEMNHYGLTVTGLLSDGKFDVKLNGTTVASYTAAELSKGVNLAGPALDKGPIADQVKDLVKAVNDKTNYYHDKIYSPLVLGRGLDKNPDFKDVAKADVAKHREALIEERMKKMPELDAAIRKALEPRPHLVEIVAAK